MKTEGDPSTAPASTDGAGDDGTGATEDPAHAPPHALGTIVLGESHDSASGSSSAVIEASFFPDASKAAVKACTRKIGACELAEVPKCTSSSSSSGSSGDIEGCASGEICSFDDDCNAKCTKVCTKVCGAAEECVLSGSTMSCKKKTRFDAGAIAFAGTTESITLFPPYAVKPDGNGAPFMAKSSIHVQATGASTSGFASFDETFTSTTFLETNPPLSDLSRDDVFGSDDLAVGWVPGEDKVSITVSGIGGSAKCTADDTTGSYDIPRAVIKAVSTTSSSSSSSSSTPSVSIQVARERHEERRDKAVVGDDAAGSAGWLELVTTSSESHAYTACSTGTVSCGETCAQLENDPQNCGSCGHTCSSSQYCESGECM